MMPEFNTAFCGRSLKTGTLIVGWVMMIQGFTWFFLTTNRIALFNETVFNLDDEKLGQVILMLQNPNDPDHQLISQNEAAKTFIHKFGVFLEMSSWLLVSNIATSDPAVTGKHLKNGLPGMVIVFTRAALFILFVHTLFYVLLLYGVKQNKPGFILPGLVLSLLVLLVYVLDVILDIFKNYVVSAQAMSILSLMYSYFTWVIYCFYRELRRKGYSAPNMPMVTMPGQELMLVTTNNVNS